MQLVNPGWQVAAWRAKSKRFKGCGTNPNSRICSVELPIRGLRVDGRLMIAAGGWSSAMALDSKKHMVTTMAMFPNILRLAALENVGCLACASRA